MDNFSFWVHLVNPLNPNPKACCSQHPAFHMTFSLFGLRGALLAADVGVHQQIVPLHPTIPLIIVAIIATNITINITTKIITNMIINLLRIVLLISLLL